MEKQKSDNFCREGYKRWLIDESKVAATNINLFPKSSIKPHVIAHRQ